MERDLHTRQTQINEKRPTDKNPISMKGDQHQRRKSITRGLQNEYYDGYAFFVLASFYRCGGEVGGWGRVPFSRNLMSPTPRRKWYLTTGRRAH